MTTLINDIKYGIRMLAKNPGFTAVVILIIGVGVGANTAIFNALDQVSLRPLPVHKAHELVGIRNVHSLTDVFLNYPLYEAYRDQSDLFSDLIAFSETTMQLRIKQEVKEISGLAVSSNYFSALGVLPALGRVYGPEQEPDTTTHAVVIISDRFRRQQFGAQSDVIGDQVVINDHPLTIVGVMLPAFTGTLVGWTADLYIPLGTYVAMRNDTIYRDTWTWLNVLGRLKPGISHERAQATLQVKNQHLKASGLENVPENLLISDGSRGCLLRTARDFHRPLTLFMIAAAFILIIATVNIANMQLLRAASRQKEIAIRQALGAGRWRVIRQLLMESLILALVGGLCGVVLAVWLDRVICVLMARIGSVSMIPGLDIRVLFFALAISLATGLAFGLAPAWQMVRRNVVPALKESAGYLKLPARRWNLHHLLVVVQVAIAVMVLICAGLFVRSMIVLNEIDPGYDASKLLAVSLGGQVFDQPDVRQFYEDLHERLKGLPGTEASSLCGSIPLSERGSQRGISHIDGVKIPRGERSGLHYGVVSPEYFKTLSMPLLAGRHFSARDSLHAPKVMIINDIMAREYWPNEIPLGKQVTLGGLENGTTMQVIGVVKSVKMRSIIEGERPMAYWPLAQDTRFTCTLLIRTTQNPHDLIPIIRQEVAALEPNKACHIRTVADHVAGLLFPQHAITIILNLFGLAGLLLCVIGIYSVIAYTVKQRTREIGIRMALGAERRHVVGPVLLTGSVLTFMGLTLGLGLSLVAIRLLERHLVGLRDWNDFMLFGVGLWEPMTFIAIPLVLFIALLACYLPARRAAQIDPMVALRYE